LHTRVSPQPKTRRKAPRQRRSRVTADAMIEAATRIPGNRGRAAFSANGDPDQVVHEHLFPIAFDSRTTVLLLA
jgi:hypothetical protein